MPDTETTVHTFAKSKSQEVRARLTTYQGRTYADLRVFAESEGEYVPTKKGISFRVEDIPKLVDAVAALEQAYQLESRKVAA